MAKYKVFTYEEVERARTDESLRDEIIKNYHALAKNITHKYYSKLINPVEDFEDFLNEALIGIYKAIYNYNGDSEFTTYVYSYIFGHLKTMAKRRAYGDKARDKTIGSPSFEFDRMQFSLRVLDSPMEGDDGKTLKDLIADEKTKGVEHLLDCDDFWNIVKQHTTSKQYKCLYLHYVYGYNYPEIAEMLNCTKQAAYAFSKKGIEKLRKIKELEQFF